MLQRAEKFYVAAAIILLNFIILFVVVNLAVAWILPPSAADVPKAPPHSWVIEKYGLKLLSRGYPGWKLGDLREFFYEAGDWPTEFEPFTQFKPKIARARFINQSPDGFRPGLRQAPWPPSASAINVFFFGGSTTMGVGLPDDQTIPSHFQGLARQCNSRVSVYNFGRGWYFSTQERILFEQLLLQGRIPNIAIFIDGLNDFHFAAGAPQWSDQLREFMDGFWDHDLGRTARHVAAQLPIARLFARVSDQVRSREAREPMEGGDQTIPDVSHQMAYHAPAPITIEPTDSELSLARPVVQRLLVNHRITDALGQAFGTKVLNVLQPVPTFGYDLRYLNVFKGDVALFGASRESAAGYRLLSEGGQEAKGDALWLGDIQRGRAQNFYVDQVHYTDAFSRELAQRLLDEIIAKGFLVCRQ